MCYRERIRCAFMTTTYVVFHETKCYGNLDEFREPELTCVNCSPDWRSNLCDSSNAVRIDFQSELGVIELPVHAALKDKRGPLLAAIGVDQPDENQVIAAGMTSLVAALEPGATPLQ